MSLRSKIARIVDSPVNYWVMMVVDLVAAGGFLVLGLDYLSLARAASAALVLAGYGFWSFLEYGLHRWALHGPPSLSSQGHDRHHRNERALISAPLLLVPTSAWILWRLLRFALHPGAASLFVFGAYVGYNHFALVHHIVHRSPGGGEYLRRRRRIHGVHHRRPAVNFGTTTTLWDRLFGTFVSTVDGRRLSLFEHDEIVVDDFR